jgi:hypothetical protein
MNDIKVIGFLIILALSILGLLLAKAFGFALAWVFWPIGILSIIFLIMIMTLSLWKS